MEVPCNMENVFRTKLSFDMFDTKYRHEGCETWDELSKVVTSSVCDGVFGLNTELKREICEAIRTMKFIPGGRYLYYAGRELKFWNNCYLLKAEEDTREDWSTLSWKAESCLITGGGIGVDYSVYRPKNSVIKRTGGVASGPISKMKMTNEQGREVMQGGSRRSALYASLDCNHQDIDDFLVVKDWTRYPIAGTNLTIADVKKLNWDFPAPLDMTNISVNYNTEWLMNYYKDGNYGATFLKNVERALTDGEPGFSFNFFEKEKETLRNACTEITSEDDSDVCNLGSVNLSRIDSIDEFKKIVRLGTIFLLCGTLGADLPYDKIKKVREKNRRLGLGLMGVHEWLLRKGSRYEVTPELHQWLSVYKGESDLTAAEYADRFSISAPVGKRAIAPVGTIGMVAGTTTGCEPVYAVAFKRRYLKNKEWHYQYAIDSVAQNLVDELGLDPRDVESSIQLADQHERRIAFQADLQDYVDQGISSTINLPSREDQKFSPEEFAETLARYAPRLRGFTCYPDGSRGGQPLTPVPYEEARSLLGREYQESLEYMDACDITGKGGYCGA